MLLEWCVYLGHGPHNLSCGMGQVAASIDGGEQGTAAARTVWPQTNGKLYNDRAEVSDISSRILSWKQKHKQDNLERQSEHLLPWLKYIKQKHNPSQAEKCMHQSRRGTKPV